jgi:hypothetical protein
MSEIVYISIKGFVIGFVSYFLYSLYHTRKERNRKPKLLKLHYEWKLTALRREIGELKQIIKLIRKLEKDKSNEV